MDSEENWAKRAKFRQLLRNKLTEFLRTKKYTLLYDNEQEAEDKRKSWVFKLKYSGSKEIEVSNDDWRDYTEYFNVYIGSEKLTSLNIDNYSLDGGYEFIEETIVNGI